jgi:glutamyl-tRNA synthetase
LLYEAFGWNPPAFAHLPLILKPTGNGKLSKRDGDKGGFPIFPLAWTDPKSSQTSNGYRENGYLPEAFLNMLLLLGWSSGDERELFSLEEAVEVFSMENVTKSGARFNPDKAVWFNEQYLRSGDSSRWIEPLKERNAEAMQGWSGTKCQQVLDMMLERVQFLHEIGAHSYLFAAPDRFDEKLIRKKWKPETAGYLRDLKDVLAAVEPFESDNIETHFKQFLATRELGFGAVLLPFRIALTGAAGGPSMFDFAEFLGKNQTLDRLESAVAKLG